MHKSDIISINKSRVEIPRVYSVSPYLTLHTHTHTLGAFRDVIGPSG